MRVVQAVILTFCLLAYCIAAAGDELWQSAPPRVATFSSPVSQKISPAVRVHTYAPGSRFTGIGSGVVIPKQSDGHWYVVTADHVISGAERCVIRWQSGQAVWATVAGRDTARDVAALRLAELPEGATYMPIAEREPAHGDKLTWRGWHGSRREWVTGVGFLRQTVNNGNWWLWDIRAGDVRPGMSGGPVWTKEGLVGIISAHGTPGREGLGPGLASVRQFLRRICPPGAECPQTPGPSPAPLSPAPIPDPIPDPTPIPIPIPDPAPTPAPELDYDRLARAIVEQLDLSQLQGPPGPEGPSGRDGNDGPQGPPGTPARPSSEWTDEEVAELARRLPPIHFRVLNTRTGETQEDKAHLGEGLIIRLNPVE